MSTQSNQPERWWEVGVVPLAQNTVLDARQLVWMEAYRKAFDYSPVDSIPLANKALAAFDKTFKP